MNKVVVTIISFSLLFSAAPGFSFLPSSHDRSQKDNIHESRESIHTHVDDEGHTHIHDDGGEIEVVFDSVEDKHSHSHQHDRNTTPHQHSHSHEGHSHGNATGGTIIGWVLNTSAKIKIPARSSKIQSAQLNNTAEDPYLSNIFRPPILI